MNGSCPNGCVEGVMGENCNAGKLISQMLSYVKLTSFMKIPIVYLDNDLR